MTSHYRKAEELVGNSTVSSDAKVIVHALLAVADAIIKRPIVVDARGRNKEGAQELANAISTHDPSNINVTVYT